MTYKIYSGIKGFPERTPIAYALTCGVKVIGLPEKVRPMKQCYPCYGRGQRDGKACSECGGRGQVRMRGGVHANDRLFLKDFRSDRPAGTPWHKGVRPLARGYEEFNGVSDDKPPTGSKELIAFLPGGELHEGLDQSVWNHHRRAPKLGVYKGLELVQNRQRIDHPEPHHQAECVGDGKTATRWMPHPETGEWGHYDIECTGEKCPFAECCNPYSRIWLQAPGTGEKNVGLMQFESNGEETASGMVGFFRRLRERAAELDMKSLYMFPVRVKIGTRTASAGPNKYGRQLQNRRWPVVDFTSAMSMLEFAQYQRQMLGGAPKRIALPAPPATPEELADSDADLTMIEEVASRPREDAPAVEPVDVEIVDETPEADVDSVSPQAPPPTSAAAGSFSPSDEVEKEEPEPVIGSAGAARLDAALKHWRTVAAPRAFPPGLTGALAESGAAAGTLPEDLTEHAAEAFRQWGEARAKSMPRQQ